MVHILASQPGSSPTLPYLSVIRHLKAVKTLIFNSFPISQWRSSLPTSSLDCQCTLSMGRIGPYLPEKARQHEKRNTSLKSCSKCRSCRHCSSFRWCLVQNWSKAFSVSSSWANNLLRNDNEQNVLISYSSFLLSYSNWWQKAEQGNGGEPYTYVRRLCVTSPISKNLSKSEICSRTGRSVTGEWQLHGSTVAVSVLPPDARGTQICSMCRQPTAAVTP